MKNIFPLLAIATVLILSVRANAQSSEMKQCIASGDFEEFKGSWKISSTIGFGFGQVYCEAKNDDTDSCAASYALDVSLKKVLGSYSVATAECAQGMTDFCEKWCGTYIKDFNLCSKKCALPNIHLVD